MNIVKKRWKGLSFLVVVALLSIIVLADNLSLPVDDLNNTSFLDNESNNSLDNIVLNDTLEVPENTPINDSTLPVEPDNKTQIPVIEEPEVNDTLTITPPVEEINEIELIEEPSLISAVLTLIIDKIVAFIGEVVNIQAILTYENDTPIPDEKIDFYADEFIGSDITDVEGKAEIEWDTSSWLPDVYTITAEYEGDEIINPVSATVDVSIEEIENKTLFHQTSANLTEHVLAKVYNQDNLEYDRQYAKKYLNLRKNFSNLEFKSILEDKEDFVLSMGNKVDDLRGIKTDKGNFAVHLVYCDEFKKFCKFRVNGVPTTRMYAPEVLEGDKSNTFDLDGDFAIKINSAKFNQCNNHRFCHLGYEGYHVVDVSVERK